MTSTYPELYTKVSLLEKKLIFSLIKTISNCLLYEFFVFEKGCRIWVSDAEEVWKNATVKSDYDSSKKTLELIDLKGNVNVYFKVSIMNLNE